jgi:hypothetical protein
VAELTSWGIESMRRRRAFLPIVLGLITIVASAVAHMAGGVPVSVEDGREAAEAMEPSATVLPALIGPLGSLLLVGAIWAIRRRRLDSLWFAIVPPIAFLLQEVAERVFDVGNLPPAGAEPSVVATLLVQLPFAVVALVVARVLRLAAQRVASFLGTRRGRPPRRFAGRLSWSPAPLFRPSPAVPAGAHFGRAPPDYR